MNEHGASSSLHFIFFILDAFMDAKRRVAMFSAVLILILSVAIILIAFGIFFVGLQCTHTSPMDRYVDD